VDNMTQFCSRPQVFFLRRVACYLLYSDLRRVDNCEHAAGGRLTRVDGRSTTITITTTTRRIKCSQSTTAKFAKAASQAPV